MTHQNIGYVLIRGLESNGISPLAAITIAIAASVGLAYCLHRWVERPSMRWLRDLKLPSLAIRSRTESLNS